jgi:hypothetical protein
VLPRLLGRESVSRGVVAASRGGVQVDDLFFGGRGFPSLKPRRLVLEFLPKVGHLSHAGIRIGERLLESFAGFVQRFEFWLVNRRNGLRRRRDRKPREDEGAREGFQGYRHGSDYKGDRRRRTRIYGSFPYETRKSGKSSGSQ